MARLNVSDLNFAYPGAPDPTLQNVNFEVKSGGSLALLGSSGAGKTTLLNLLSGLLPSMEGKIELDGVDVAGMAPAARGVAQVFQFPVLYDSLSVRDNIGFPLRTRGVARREQHTRAEAIAELFDLTEVLGAKPVALSLFQKQLVGFAKALVRDDLAMVLLDEPLTAVEPAMKWRLRGAVKRAQAELGVTMVYVTHDQTEALTFADEVSVLHGGRLLQTGTPAELYDRPVHSEVARFIGNPGMNVLPAEIADGRMRIAGELVAGDFFGLPDGALEIGFRPEWAALRSMGESESPGPAKTDKQEKEKQKEEKQKGDENEKPAPLLSLDAKVQGQRLTGASAGKRLGVARVAVGGETAAVACELHTEPDRSVRLEIDRYRLFRDGWSLDSEAVS